MTKVSDTLWTQLVEAHARADREATAAYAAYDDTLPVSSNDGQASAEELRVEELRRLADQHEERLLSVEAPNLSGVLYQLRVFGLRELGIDVDEPPGAGEQQEQRMFRTIYAGLRSL